MQKREDMIKKFLLMLLSGAFVSAAAVPARAEYTQLAKLTASDAASGDGFGSSVAISGSTALVGAPYNDPGSAYLLDVSDPSNPVEIAKLTASDAGDGFGLSVALSGSTALVGSPWDNDGGFSSGSAYLFDVSDPSNPVEIAKLTASDAASGDLFGASVGISGATALVGASYNNDAGTGSGSAYLYDFSDPSNIIETKLTASDAAAHDQFGQSVAISGATALVGAHGNGSFSGSAYLFDVATGNQIAKLTPSDAAPYDYFGWSVAISGSTALVGAYDKGDVVDRSGSAYLFDVGTGGEIAKLTASDAARVDRFGYSVAISGATALVGAERDDDAGLSSGSAYLFDVATGRQIAKLTADDAAAQDRFGSSVAISGSSALVGAHANDDAGLSSGSAYLFGSCLFPPVGDINLDCRVDLSDFALMAGNWQVNCDMTPADPACQGP